MRDPNAGDVYEIKNNYTSYTKGKLTAGKHQAQNYLRGQLKKMFDEDVIIDVESH